MRKCIRTRFEPLQALKIFFKGLDSDGQEMHQNTFLTIFFLTIPEVKKIIFSGLDSGVLETHQNTFLTTPDAKKIIF